MGERKKKNYLGDFLRWAEFSGLDISPKARDLLKSDALPPLRAAIVAQDLGRFEDFHHAAYAARWCEGRDLSQPDELAGLLTRTGFDADDVMARAEDPGVQERLDAETRRAIDKGAFGVPTMFIDDQMFWGNDRFELVRFYLERKLQRRTG